MFAHTPKTDVILTISNKIFFFKPQGNRLVVIVPKNFKKLYGPFFMDGVQLLPRLQALQGGSLLFTIQFPEIAGTHFIDLRRMKGWVELGATQSFWTRDPWIENPGALTTRPLLQPSRCLLHSINATNIEIKFGQIENNFRNTPLTCFYIYCEDWDTSLSYFITKDVRAKLSNILDFTMRN